MRYVTVTEVCYNLRLRREGQFRLTYKIDEGPRLGIERWFLVRKEEMEDTQMAA